MTQLGPASAVLRLGCDCRYSMRVTLTFGRIREDGEYRVEDGQIILSRSKGETPWPYTLREHALTLTEYQNETHEYRLVKQVSCR